MTENRPSLDEIFGNSASPEVSSTESATQERPSLDEIFAKPEEDSSMIWGSKEGNAKTALDPKQGAISSVSGPIEGIANSVLKGYAETAAGANTKLLSISKLVNSPIFDTKDLQDSFRKNSQYWQQVQKEADDNGGDNFILNMLGGLPIAAAEFGATKNPVSMVVAGGVLSALQDYGKEVENNPEAEIKFGKTAEAFAGGAAGTALAVGALHVAGVGIEKLGILVQKHGVQTVKNMFTAMNGGDERMGQRAIDLLSDPRYNKKEKLIDPATNLEQQAMRVEEYKGQSKEQFLMETQAKKQEMFSRQQDFDFNIRQREREIRNDVDLKVSKADDAIIDMQQKKLEVIDGLKESSSEQIANSANIMADSIDNAKNSVKQQIDTVFSGMLRKVEGLKSETGKAQGAAWSKLIELHPSEGANVSKVIDKIRSADGGEQLFNFKPNGGIVFVTPKVDNKVMNEAAEQLQNEINSALFQRSGMSARQGEKVTANTMKITHDIFDNAARLPEGQGSLAPGIGKIYSNLADAFHVKNYVDDFSAQAKPYVSEILELNKKYGGYKDRLSEVYSRYFKRDGDVLVPKTDEIFARFDRGDRLYEAKLLNAENIQGLSPQDKVYAQVRKSYENFKKVRSAEESANVGLKKSLQRNISMENQSFSESIRNLRLNKRNLSSQESQKMSDLLFTIKQSRDMENKAISDVFDDKLRKLAQSRSEGLRSLRDQISDENLTLETKRMLRSFRPKEGVSRIMQNIGLYGATSSAIGGLTGVINPATALPMALGKGILAVSMSPRAVSKVTRFAFKNKESIKAAAEKSRETGKVMHSSVLLKRLVAAQASR